MSASTDFDPDDTGKIDPSAVCGHPDRRDCYQTLPNLDRRCVPADGAGDRTIALQRMMKSPILVVAGALIASVGWVATTQAAPRLIGTFKAWSAYVAVDTDGKVCFVAAQPQDSKYSQAISGRGGAFLMVTTVPSKNITNQLSTIVGFPFKAGSHVSANVDGRKYKMFFNDSAGETAWSVPNTEPAFIKAMKKGAKMRITSTSKRGTVVTDNYSLYGVTAALDAVARGCK